MEWTQFIIFFLGVFGLFIWNRTESRNDIRYMDSKLEANRDLVRAMQSESRDNQDKTRHLISVIQSESKEIIKAIEMEMKDFHYRLLEKDKRDHKNDCNNK